MEKERKLTELQEKFLDVLISEAKGDFKKAIALAGYSEHTKVHEVVGSLREEIVKRTMDYLVMNGPKAASNMVDLLDNPTRSGAVNVIKVASSILDRMGVINQTGQLGLKVPRGGLVILPAKGNARTEDTEEDSED